MQDIIGPRFNKLGNQFPFLQFTPEEEQRVLTLLAELERIFKTAETRQFSERDKKQTA